VARAETLGGGAYGMEALNVLRLEKGFITHAEIHGRVTADDVGMGRMVSAKKDCIGKTASQRPGLSGEDREQLVGLKPKDPEQALLAGAHLFREGDAATRVNDQGYVTSVAWSPTMETHIGLGFLLNGRARHRGDGAHGRPSAKKDHALRGLRPGLLRPRGRARPWLT
jgi:glycine cleavage system aminomethyltransferase T